MTVSHPLQPEWEKLSDPVRTQLCLIAPPASHFLMCLTSVFSHAPLSIYPFIPALVPGDCALCSRAPAPHKLIFLFLYCTLSSCLMNYIIKVQFSAFCFSQKIHCIVFAFHCVCVCVCECCVSMHSCLRWPSIGRVRRERLGDFAS